MHLKRASCKCDNFCVAAHGRAAPQHELAMIEQTPQTLEVAIVDQKCVA